MPSALCSPILRFAGSGLYLCSIDLALSPVWSSEQHYIQCLLWVKPLPLVHQASPKAWRFVSARFGAVACSVGRTLQLTVLSIPLAGHPCRLPNTAYCAQCAQCTQCAQSGYCSRTTVCAWCTVRQPARSEGFAALSSAMRNRIFRPPRLCDSASSLHLAPVI